MPRSRLARRAQSSRRQGEYLMPRLGDPDRVLELCRKRTVARHRRPAVGENLHLRPTEIDHRLDGEDQAGLENDPLAGRAVVEDVGDVMEQPADAMAAEIADDAAAL